MTNRFLAVAAVAAGAALTGPALAQDSPRFVVVTHGQASDPFWSVVKNAVDTAAEEVGANVEYRAPTTFDMVQMSQLIDAAVASQPDGLVVSIPDADALGDSIRNAVAAGIPVISINSGSDVYADLGVRAHVGQTEYEAGFGGGEQMGDVDPANAMCLNYEVGNVALDLRCQGFADALGGEVDVLATTNDPTEIRSAVQAYLTNNPDTEAILTVGVLGATPAAEAIEQVGLSDQVKLATFDLSPEVLRAIADGEIEFAIDQQQYLQGYLPIVMLDLNERYGTLPAGVVQTGPGFVTQENAEQVIELSKQGIR